MNESIEERERSLYSEAYGFSASFHPFAIGSGARCDGFDAGWRRLPASLLEIPSGGSWLLWLEGRRSPERASSGEALLIPAGVRHRLRCEADGSMETRFLLGSWRWLSHVDMLARAGLPAKLPASLGGRLLPLLDRLAGLWAGGCRSPKASASFHAAAFEILALLLAAVPEGELASPADGLERIAKALEAMNARPEAPHSCRTLAAKAGLSPSRFNAVFRAHTGLGPKPYLQDLRARKAAALLLGGGLRSKEVAAACGFKSDCYFSRFFSKRVGMSPEAFRKAFLRQG